MKSLYQIKEILNTLVHRKYWEFREFKIKSVELNIENFNIYINKQLVYVWVNIKNLKEETEDQVFYCFNFDELDMEFKRYYEQ